jgi:hypothetical protein
MEAAGAPRLDAERLTDWSAAQRGALVSVGHRGRDKERGFVPRPMPPRWPRNEACAP